MKDQLGIICSGLCIVHCVATPFILALGVSGLLATILTTELVHYILIVTVGILVLLTLPIAYKQNGVLSPVLTGLLGILFLIAALFLGEEKEVLLTIIGGSLLVIFHLWNLRLQHKHKTNGTIVSRLLIRPTAEYLLIRPKAEDGIDIKNLNEKRAMIYAKK
jgi:hypothetical protein